MSEYSAERLNLYLEERHHELGGPSEGELKWDAFADAVAKGLDVVDMDGDQEEDGYSMDLCYAMYEGGNTIKDTILEFKGYMEGVRS